MVMLAEIWCRLSKNLCLPCHSLTFMRSSKTKTGSWFYVQKSFAPHSGITCSRRKPHFDARFESYWDGRKSSGVDQRVQLHSNRKGGHRGSVHDVQQSTTSLISTSSAMQVSNLLQFLDKGQHLQLWCNSPLFCNHKWFNLVLLLGGRWAVSQRCHWTIHLWYWILL